MAPFNNEAKHEIKLRSEGTSELDGREYLPSLLLCGHINHDKDHPDYDNPENGMRVTLWQECAYHMIHQADPSEIGLTRESNTRAVYSSLQNLSLLGYSPEEIRGLIGEAMGQWEEWKRERLIQENIERAHEINGCGEENKKYIYGDTCLYYEPDEQPKIKKKERYKGYIPPAL